MKKQFIKLCSSIVAICMVIGLFPVTVFGASNESASVNAQNVVAPDGQILVSQTDYEIQNGVTQSNIILNNEAGNAQVMGYMATISPDASVKFKASYGGYYKGTNSNDWKVDSWKLEKTTQQAADYEAATGENVVVGVNGDFFNMQTGQPLGNLVMNGTEYNGEKADAEPYFAELKDGSHVIRTAGTSRDDVQEAVSGPIILIKDGEIQWQYIDVNDNTLIPTNAIGIKADGTVVMFIADGRQAPVSIGLTVTQEAEFMKSQGCVDALYLDGGGSATFASKIEGTNELTVQNSPSDGSERTVSSALLVVSTATGDGNFDHARLQPNNKNYTAGSTVEFTATGIDKAGQKAELPEGVKWQLDENSTAKGTIDENTGIFISDGTLGQAIVNLVNNGTIVGTTSINIVDVDNIYFGSESISLDFGEKSDLGLVVRSSGCDVNYKPGDFNWTIKSTDEGLDDAAVGSMDGNTFVAGNSGSTMHGTVEVSYTKKDGTVLKSSIAVEIGKMPVTAFDFEPDKNGNPLTAAHYHWGKSTYVDDGTTEGYRGNVSPITVITSGTYTGNPTYATLEAPYRFTGNWDTDVPAADIFRANGYSYYLWPNGSMTTYNCGSLNTTTEAEGGQVRFGDYSLELNYDYASYDGSKNANYYIRYCGEKYDIEGTPKELGVWVYADSTSYGYSLYADIEVWDGSDYSTKNLKLTAANGSGYINWTGWMYCSADMSGLSGYATAEHPLAIVPGCGLFWLSYQPGNGLAGRYAGTIYFDNYRFVYGTDTDDLENPVINSITVNATEVNDENTADIDDTSVEIKALYEDPESDNRSGIDASKTSIMIDGAVVPSDNSETDTTSRIEISNGLHCVQVTVYDKFGNSGTKTGYFNINDGTVTDTVTLSGEDIVTMGSNYDLNLTSKGTVSKVEMTVYQLNSDFGKPTATFDEGWTGDVVYKETGFKKAMMTITASYTGKGDVPSDAHIGTLSFNVPTTVDPEIDFFTYQVERVISTLPSGTVNTSAQPKVTLKVSAYYTVNADVSIAGKETELTVKDPDGNPASDVGVYINGILAGNTDANGQLLTDVSKSLSAGATFTVQAKKDNLVSFNTTITVVAASGNAEGKPTSLSLSANSASDNSESISWMANPSYADSKAVVQYVKASEYNEGNCTYTTAEGTSSLHAFSTDKAAALINSVKVTGLEAGTEYCYRAGDGNDEHWSDIKKFTTSSSGSDTEFFVLGDTQMSGSTENDQEAIAMLNNIGSQVKEYNFGIQTGDYVDNGGSYTMWDEIQSVFGSSFDGIDMIHTLGNHEYYGDANADASAGLFGLDNREYYSVQYGNVYVATINYGANLDEALNWLIDDAQESNARWRILTLHQPPYYTNVNGGSERFNKAVPAAAQKAGINVVFSGHDHSYARTKPMIDGQVDENDGVVYFICGDLGEKSRNINYKAVNTPEFNFDFMSQDYSSLYLDVSANKSEMTITAYNVGADGSVEQLDSYTTTAFHKNCKDDGHVYDENSIYNRSTGMLKCSRCGEEISALDIKYTGFAVDSETSKPVYLYQGNLSVGWTLVGKDYYYFDENGLGGFNGIVNIDGIDYEFENGRLLHGTWVEDENGRRYYYAGKYVQGRYVIDGITYLFGADGYAVNGFYESNNKKYYGIDGVMQKGLFIIDGKYYYFSTHTGEMRTGVYTVYPENSNGLLKIPTEFDFGKDGGAIVENRDGFVVVDGKTYYYKDGLIQLGLYLIDNKYYYFSTHTGEMRTGEYTVYPEASNGLLSKPQKINFGEDGGALHGFVTNNNKKYYYLYGDMQKGLCIINNKYYYFSTHTGEMRTGVYTVYPEASNGLLKVVTTFDFGDYGAADIPNEDGFVVNNGKTYYYKDGEMQIGLHIINEKYYYFSTHTGEMRTGVYTVYPEASNGLLEVATTLDFGDDGAADIPNEDGFVVDNGKTYYYKNGEKLMGLQIIGNKYYYFSTHTGEMRTGVYTVYPEASNGLLKVATTFDFGNDGAADIPNEDGFSVKDGKTYYYKDGEMLIGLQIINEKYYYFSTHTGEMRTGVYKVYPEASNGLLQVPTIFDFGDDGAADGPMNSGKDTVEKININYEPLEKALESNTDGMDLKYTKETALEKNSEKYWIIKDNSQEKIEQEKILSIVNKIEAITNSDIPVDKNNSDSNIFINYDISLNLIMSSGDEYIIYFGVADDVSDNKIYVKRILDENNAKETDENGLYSIDFDDLEAYEYLRSLSKFDKLIVR